MRSAQSLRTSSRRSLTKLFKPDARFGLAVFKAGLASALAVVLPFVDRFNGLSKHPTTLTWTVLTAIIGCTGSSVGACLEANALGLAGLAIGSLAFYVLAIVGKSGSVVGQGLLFAVFVYLCALVRWNGTRYIPFYLTAILFSFQGVYTTTTMPNANVSEWLLAFFQAFAWGFAISIAVNLFVWPTSAESELRLLIVSSLRHVSTLAHLICKSYAHQVDQDELEVTKLLSRTIRSDFTALADRLEETSYEVTFSRWKLEDYRQITTLVRGLQQALITSSSALDLIHSLDPEGINTRNHLFADKETMVSFVQFRQKIDFVITNIIDRLENQKHPKPSTIPPSLDVESQSIASRRMSSQSSVYNITRVFSSIGARLRDEVRQSERRHERIRSANKAGATGNEKNAHRSGAEMVKKFRRAWQTFEIAHKETIIRLIKEDAGQTKDTLLLTAGMPSLLSMYLDRLPKAWSSSLASERELQRSPSTLSSSEHSKPELDPGEESKTLRASEVLVKAYSLLFGLGQFSDDLCKLYELVDVDRPLRLQTRIWEVPLKFPWIGKKSQHMSLQEALAALHGDEYKRRRVSIIEHLAKFEGWLRSPHSLYALKVALGATNYSLLLLVSNPRPFFVQYGMTSSLITVIVAISPSMGQTLTTFLLQIGGSGIGSVFGLITCEIFKHVGGYAFNPYGLGVFMLLWSIAAACPVHSDRKYYTGSLLAANGAGTLLVLEWMYNEVPAVKGPYPDAPLRAAYAITSTCISVAIAATFQILIFRSPARRQLRLKIGAITSALSSYNTILQSNINAVAPSDEKPIPPLEALNKIQRELIKRETQIQADIIALGPLFEFSRNEPSFVAPFQAETIHKIIQSHQVILDRLREARTSVGTNGFNQTIHQELITIRLSRTLFYLGATSIVSKTPLPRDVPSSRSTWAAFENDALVLARRLSKLPHGEEELRKPGFLRYWFYLVAVGSVSRELEQLETYLGEWFGVPEVANPNIA